MPFGIELPNSLSSLSNAVGNVAEAGKEKLRMETMAKTLGYNLPKDIHFNVEDGERVNNKDTKNLSAEITQEQKENITKVLGSLSADEKKALFGDLKFRIDTSQDGKSHLVLVNASSHTLDEVNNFNREKNGSAAGLTAALAGDEQAAHAALKTVQQPSPASAPGKPAESIPLSSAEQPLDLGKLAAAGLKIPETQAVTAGHASGVEAVQKATERGIA